MKNADLVERRFTQIDGKIKTLKFLLSRDSSKKEFTSVINELDELVVELKSMIDRENNALRRG
jgi:hypothetical protein|tara:strand:- start:205 stop:393 length:189 start_codon:yes stop_codon:yes gene_type:complete